MHRVDAGVSDFNRNTFHEFSRLVDELGVTTQPINNDADFVAIDGRSRLSVGDGVWSFASQVVDPVELEKEIDAFRMRAAEVLFDPQFASWTVERYLNHIGASGEFRQLYLLPRVMGCFPLPDGDPAQCSVLALIQFWKIHGLIGEMPADRHCVVGGMHRYVLAYEQWFRRLGGTVRTATNVLGIAREKSRVVVRTRDRSGRESQQVSDHVILTCHARQALGLLDDPRPTERRTLSHFACQSARVVVHHDETLLSADRQTWGAFNYLIPEGDWPLHRPTITFYPNRLASLPNEVPDTFVTLNPAREPLAERIVADRMVLHPILGAGTEWLASCVEQFQGRDRTWFAGSYLRTPAVHESALTSGMHAAQRLIEREGSIGTASRLAGFEIKQEGLASGKPLSW